MATPTQVVRLELKKGCIRRDIHVEEVYFRLSDDDTEHLTNSHDTSSDSQNLARNTPAMSRLSFSRSMMSLYADPSCYPPILLALRCGFFGCGDRRMEYLVVKLVVGDHEIGRAKAGKSKYGIASCVGCS